MMHICADIYSLIIEYLDINDIIAILSTCKEARSIFWDVYAYFIKFNDQIVITKLIENEMYDIAEMLLDEYTGDCHLPLLSAIKKKNKKLSNTLYKLSDKSPFYLSCVIEDEELLESLLKIQTQWPYYFNRHNELISFKYEIFNTMKDKTSNKYKIINKYVPEYMLLISLLCYPNSNFTDIYNLVCKITLKRDIKCINVFELCSDAFRWTLINSIENINILIKHFKKCYGNMSDILYDAIVSSKAMFFILQDSITYDTLVQLIDVIIENKLFNDANRLFSEIIYYDTAFANKLLEKYIQYDGELDKEIKGIMKGIVNCHPFYMVYKILPYQHVEKIKNTIHVNKNVEDIIKMILLQSEDKPDVIVYALSNYTYPSWVNINLLSIIENISDDCIEKLLRIPNIENIISINNESLIKDIKIRCKKQDRQILDKYLLFKKYLNLLNM